jgi:hypothetical protein
MSLPKASADKPSRLRCDASPLALNRWWASEFFSPAGPSGRLVVLDACFSGFCNAATCRFSAAISERYLVEALFSDSVSALISLRAMREISVLRRLAMFDMRRIVPALAKAVLFLTRMGGLYIMRLLAKTIEATWESHLPCFSLPGRGGADLLRDGFAHLLRDGMVDAWRMRNPAAREFTWSSTRGNGFRIATMRCARWLEKTSRPRHQAQTRLRFFSWPGSNFSRELERRVLELFERANLDTDGGRLRLEPALNLSKTALSPEPAKSNRPLLFLPEAVHADVAEVPFQPMHRPIRRLGRRMAFARRRTTSLTVIAVTALMISSPLFFRRNPNCVSVEISASAWDASVLAQT